jgi:hypothetical protein
MAKNGKAWHGSPALLLFRGLETDIIPNLKAHCSVPD